MEQVIEARNLCNAVYLQLLRLRARMRRDVGELPPELDPLDEHPRLTLPYEELIAQVRRIRGEHGEKGTWRDVARRLRYPAPDVAYRAHRKAVLAVERRSRCEAGS